MASYMFDVDCRAALHNVSVIGDPHGAVLEPLQVSDALNTASAGYMGNPCGPTWNELVRARELYAAARARFAIISVLDAVPQEAQ